MSRLQQLMSAVGRPLARLQTAAFERHQLAVQRRILHRPHVPSTYLVAGYPSDLEPLPVLQDVAFPPLWFSAALLLVAFSAGFLVADIVRPTTPAVTPDPIDLTCSTQYEPSPQ